MGTQIRKNLTTLTIRGFAGDDELPGYNPMC